MNKNIIDIIYFSDDECVMTISFPYAWDDDGMTYIQDKMQTYIYITWKVINFIIAIQILKGGLFVLEWCTILS